MKKFFYAKKYQCFEILILHKISDTNNPTKIDVEATIKKKKTRFLVSEFHLSIMTLFFQEACSFYMRTQILNLGNSRDLFKTNNNTSQ